MPVCPFAPRPLPIFMAALVCVSPLFGQTCATQSIPGICRAFPTTRTNSRRLMTRHLFPVLGKHTFSLLRVFPSHLFPAPILFGTLCAVGSASHCVGVFSPTVPAHTSFFPKRPEFLLVHVSPLPPADMRYKLRSLASASLCHHRRPAKPK